MRKILFITLSTILLLAGLLYFNSNYRQEQVNIIYDNLPYKTKVEIKQIARSIQNFAIYDGIYSDKKANSTEKILSQIENPIFLEQNSNNIDKIINYLIDEQELSDYKGIKIVLLEENPIKLPKIKLQNKNGYVLHFGFYPSSQIAQEKKEQLIQINSRLKDLSINIKQIKHDEKIMYSLFAYCPQDFNTAYSLCESLNKNKPNCIITQMLNFNQIR